ncbi:MAG: Nramp family divalent metal transporter [Roseibacillus sp.]
MAADPYQLSADRTLDPPGSFTGKLRFLGPGFILSASIVGSGELIMTTLLGAKAGFVCLWVVIFSCLVKVALQLEFGKHAIYTGKTTMTALNELPGPRIGRANWSIWSWLLIMSFKFLQVGGIVGGVALIFMEIAKFSVLPQLPVMLWTILTAVAVALIVARGRYSLLEKWSLVMIALFTVFTLISVIAVQWTPYAVSGEELLSGLSLKLPAGTLLIAVGAFGITGVGGDEIMAYNYWLLEKGYAGYTGPRPNHSDREAHQAWVARARGWIKVMNMDAVFAMFCYTLVTVLFYILGAAILHRIGEVPEKGDLVPVLAKMYTEALGGWARGIFLAGALVVLFSTLLAALAAWARLFTDAFSQLGWGDFQDPAIRRKFITGCAFIFPGIWGLLFLVFEAPALMVTIGGVASAFILLIVVFAAIVMHLKWLPAELKPGPFYKSAFVLSSLAIIMVAVISIGKAIGWF